MIINQNSDKPIYLKLAEALEDSILEDIYKEETQIISTTEMSIRFKINPATALKSVNLLVNEDIIYKKRGVGMFVSKGAKDNILKKRKVSFYKNYILTLLDEASILNISKTDLMKMIEGSNENE